jgi:hypothetical protein
MGKAPLVQLGVAAGWLISPLFGFVSLVRHARTFHPRGPIFTASVAKHPGTPAALVPLANRLAGRALVRFSGALWKHAERVPDVLGCAIRFRRDERETHEPDPDDQDLLFATIRRPWTMPLSPVSTDVRDYLANDYFGVAPFDAALGHAIYLRLHPVHPANGEAETRRDRLAHAAARGDATLNLEVGDGPYGPWTAIVVVSLERTASVDGEALRFDPFRTGRGVRPRGFIHALRRGVYSMSQRSRPSSAGPG